MDFEMLCKPINMSQFANTQCQGYWHNTNINILSYKSLTNTKWARKLLFVTYKIKKKPLYNNYSTNINKRYLH